MTLVFHENSVALPFGRAFPQVVDAFYAGTISGFRERDGIGGIVATGAKRKNCSYSQGQKILFFHVDLGEEYMLFQYESLFINIWYKRL